MALEDWDASDAERVGKRPRDIDESLLNDLRGVATGFQTLSTSLDNVKKKTWAVYVVIAAVVILTWRVAVFVENYNRNATVGTPALATLKAELIQQNVATEQKFTEQIAQVDSKVSQIAAKDDARYDKLNEVLIKLTANQEQGERRLRLLEDRR